MKYCAYCGKEIDDNAVICVNCGCQVGQINGNNKSSGGVGGYSILSIIGFVFSFIMPVVGLVCSIIAFNKAKTDLDEKSKGFAKAGIIISSVFLAVEVLAVIAAVVCVVILASVLGSIGYYPSTLVPLLFI